MQIFGKTNINFIKWRWHAIVVSSLVIVAGIGQIIAQGGPRLGVDFSGGTALVLRFDGPISEDAVRTALSGIEGNKSVQQYGPASANEVFVRLPQGPVAEEGTNLDDSAQRVDDLIRAANLGVFTRESTEIVGPVVGADLQRKGIYATLTAMLGIMVYVGFRFRFTFAFGAVVATFHDVLVTLVMLNWFGYELSLNIVAALLTMTGYSVNDTIVIFDRVRENSRTSRRDGLENVVNTSVNQMLGRTIITSGTTFIAVMGLYFYGGEVLQGFAFTMLVGIVVGTYSTVFIAAAVAIGLSKPSPAVVAADAKRNRAKK
ncbi:MAG: protein translocase subunit SecF [Acidobacteria bacterium]|jgi:preprotein translocase subunit SecF|nr:protein translocase subunit SecF [Acidobacteriota bacterium]